MDAHKINQALTEMRDRLRAMGFDTADVWMRFGPEFQYLNVYTTRTHTITRDTPQAMIREALDYIDSLDAEQAA